MDIPEALVLKYAWGTLKEALDRLGTTTSYSGDLTPVQRLEQLGERVIALTHQQYEDATTYRVSDMIPIIGGMGLRLTAMYGLVTDKNGKRPDKLEYLEAVWYPDADNSDEALHAEDAGLLSLTDDDPEKAHRDVGQLELSVQVAELSQPSPWLLTGR